MRGDRGSFCLPGAGLDLPSRPLAAVSAFPVEPACQDSSSANEEDERPLQDAEKEAPVHTSSPNTTVYNHE